MSLHKRARRLSTFRVKAASALEAGGLGMLLGNTWKRNYIFQIPAHNLLVTVLVVVVPNMTLRRSCGWCRRVCGDGAGGHAKRPRSGVEDRGCVPSLFPRTLLVVGLQFWSRVAQGNCRWLHAAKERPRGGCDPFPTRGLARNVVCRTTAGALLRRIDRAM
jgi:hypothetical protein